MLQVWQGADRARTRLDHLGPAHHALLVPPLGIHAPHEHQEPRGQEIQIDLFAEGFAGTFEDLCPGTFSSEFEPQEGH